MSASSSESSVAPMPREELRALLDGPNPHDITAAADAVRRARHALRTTFTVTDHLDPDGAWTHCPVTGEIAPDGGFARGLEGVADATTDLVLLPPVRPTQDDLRRLWEMLPPRPEVGEGEVLPTVQLGCTDQWIHAIGADDPEAALADWAARGLQVISDGVQPEHHCALGNESAAHWERFWRAAAAAGLRGHAVVLFGPEHGLDSVFAQIDAIAALQEQTGVFLSVAPCVVTAGGFTGAGDHLATQASLDLRVLAACRLGLAGIEHLSLRYERSDLKSAHTSLLCGVDDLVGHLFLGVRDRKADAEAIDLSLPEMEKWLSEAGFEPWVRNGVFEELGVDAVLDAVGATGEDADEAADEAEDRAEGRPEDWADEADDDATGAEEDRA